MASSVADYALEVAFDEIVSGIFYIDTSELDGTDGLSDVGLFDGVYDDVYQDVSDPITVTFGTDSMIGAVQAASMTFTVSRVDDPGYWNPNNPASPLVTAVAGLTPMRPVRLTGTQDGVTYGVFYGFIRHANWRAETRSCEIYCEDLLLWCSRAYPTIASTGATTTGAAIGLILDAIGWTEAAFRDLATGDSIDDFSADGTVSALALISALLQTERGSVYVRGDGVFVYESRDMAQTRAAAATLSVTQELGSLASGIDLDSIFTRATVTKIDGTGATIGSWSASDTTAEQTYGRADLAEISSPYVPDGGGQALADDLVYGGVQGSPPIVAEAFNVDAATLTTILSSPLLSVFAISDTLGGTDGEGVVQRIVHTIGTASHRAEYTLAKRTTDVFTVDGSDLAGTDPLRY